MVVSCADSIVDARAKLATALQDAPECLNVETVAAFVSGQPPSLEGAADDPALALYADLFV